MLRRNEYLYVFQFGAFFITSFLLALHSRSVDRFYDINEVVLGCLLILSTTIACAAFFLLYKTYAAIRKTLCPYKRNSNSTADTDESSHYSGDEDEIAVLMQVWDANTPAPSVPTDVYGRLLYAVRQRNHLLTNIYIVSVGVFLSVFPLACLDHKAVLYFTIGIWILSAREAYYRTLFEPICYRPNQLTEVWNTTNSLEVLVIVGMGVAIAIYLFIVPSEPTSYIAYPYDVIIQVGAFISPFLIQIAPDGNHSMVVVETALPVSGFLAMVVLYALSPITATLDIIRDTHEIWLVFSMLPFGFLILLLALINLLRAELSMIALFVLSSLFLSTLPYHLFFSKPSSTADESNQLILMLSFILLFIPCYIIFGYLLYYRNKHVLWHRMRPFHETQQAERKITPMVPKQPPPSAFSISDEPTSPPPVPPPQPKQRKEPAAAVAAKTENKHPEP